MNITLNFSTPHFCLQFQKRQRNEGTASLSTLYYSLIGGGGGIYYYPSMLTIIIRAIQFVAKYTLHNPQCSFSFEHKGRAGQI